MAVFVRSQAQVSRAQDTVARADTPCETLDQKLRVKQGAVSVTTMHRAKGLEFRAVAAMACDDEVIPLQEWIENVSDDSDLEEVYHPEQHLLYVACTWARDQLLLTGVSPASDEQQMADLESDLVGGRLFKSRMVTNAQELQPVLLPNEAHLVSVAFGHPAPGSLVLMGRPPSRCRPRTIILVAAVGAAVIGHAVWAPFPRFDQPW